MTLEAANVPHARSAPALINTLQEQIHACLAEFFTGAPFAIVDFPNIRNVGDSAIWLGEIAYLTRRHGVKPAYVSEMYDFSEEELNARVPEGPVFIHGGGNFGDIWMGHQNFRERILRSCVGRPVVQFPQSIHYSSPQRIDETARLIDRHGNFTLLVRDEESKQFSEKHFNCRVVLCPDMALCIGPLQSAAPQIPLLAMLREDREKAGTQDVSVLGDVPVEDWISEPWLPVRVAKTMGMVGAMSLDTLRMRYGRFNAAANQRFGRGIRQISRARTLITDRLHVHILSLLLGRPHAVLDNSYGKIARFMAAFSGGTDLAYRASSLADALEWAKSRSENQA
jgi:pyruvyl transferase EpsO